MKVIYGRSASTKVARNQSQWKVFLVGAGQHCSHLVKFWAPLVGAGRDWCRRPSCIDSGPRRSDPGCVKQLGSVTSHKVADPSCSTAGSLLRLTHMSSRPLFVPVCSDAMSLHRRGEGQTAKVFLPYPHLLCYVLHRISPLCVSLFKFLSLVV